MGELKELSLFSSHWGPWSCSQAADVSCCPCHQPAVPYSGGGLPARERQKPKMEVIMHKSADFDEAVAQESAAGGHQQRSDAPRWFPWPSSSLEKSAKPGQLHLCPAKQHPLSGLDTLHC